MSLARVFRERKLARERELEAKLHEEIVERRSSVVTMSWTAVAFSTLGVILSVAASRSYLGLKLSIAAGTWMTVLHVMDNQSEREAPRLLRWAIYAFAVVASMVVIAGLFHR